MDKRSVIAGPASEEIAEKLAKRLKADLTKTKLRVFPDGESKITLDKKPKGKNIIVVQSTYPPVDSNFIQLLTIISKAKEHSQKITVVIPYLGYARQDREFLRGEIITLKAITELIKNAGAKRVIVVDIHSKIGLNLFKIPTANISAVSELVNYFKKLRLKNPLVVSPDTGGIERARKFSKLLGLEFIALEKNRDRKSGKVTIVSKKISDVKNRDLILVDDMISTGGSIIKASEFLKKQRCGKIFVACTHALLINNAEKKIKRAGVTRIISTNTIPGNTSLVDVSEIISKAIM